MEMHIYLKKNQHSHQKCQKTERFPGTFSQRHNYGLSSIPIPTKNSIETLEALSTIVN